MKKGINVLKVLSIIVATAALSACGNINTTKDKQNVATGTNLYTDNSASSNNGAVPQNYTLSRFTWNVTGAADIQFTVSPLGTNFNINVTRYQGRALNVNLRMSPTDSASAHNMLTRVFSGYDGFVNGYPYSNGTYSSIAQIDITGKQVPLIQYPQLYSGDTASLSALFQNISSRIY